MTRRRWDGPGIDPYANPEPDGNTLSLPRLEDIPPEVLEEMHPEDIQYLRNYWRVFAEIAAERRQQDAELEQKRQARLRARVARRRQH